MKTEAEINAAAAILQQEADSTPEFDAFGDSNEEALNDLKNWIADLEGGPPFATQAVKDWVAGTEGWSPLKDYID